MAERSLYDILGILEDASPSDVRAAYRRKMQTIHPDTGGSEEAAKQVNAAYDVLSDPPRRADYDRSRRQHALVCPMCDSPVSTDTELMEHIIRHRAEVAAAQQVVGEAARKTEAQRASQDPADAERRDAEQRQAASGQNASRGQARPAPRSPRPEPGSPVQSSHKSRTMAGLLMVGGLMFLTAAVLTAVILISDNSEANVQAAAPPSSRVDAVEATVTTTTASPTTSSTRPATTTSSTPLGVASTTPVVARASASELLFGQPTTAWNDEGGMVSDALMSASLGWSGPDDWGIVADGELTDLWVWGGGCVDDVCDHNMTFATAGSDSDRHAWWLFLDGAGMNASVALAFELGPNETTSLGCWSDAYLAPAIFTLEADDAGVAARAWVYTDVGDGSTWHVANPTALDIDPTWASDVFLFIPTSGPHRDRC